MKSKNKEKWNIKLNHNHSHGGYFAPATFEALNDLADERALHSVRLDQHERAFHIQFTIFRCSCHFPLLADLSNSGVIVLKCCY